MFVLTFPNFQLFTFNEDDCVKRLRLSLVAVWPVARCKQLRRCVCVDYMIIIIISTANIGFIAGTLIKTLFC